MRRFLWSVMAMGLLAGQLPWRPPNRRPVRAPRRRHRMMP